MPAFQLVACLTVIFPIVDLWQCCVCCTRSGVTRSTYFVALYLCLMCQSGYTWCFDRTSVYILLRLPALEPHSTTGLLFPSQYLSGMIWLTSYLMVWDWQASRAGPMPFCWPSCSLLFCLQLFSVYLLFLYRLVVYGWGLPLIGCQSPSPGLVLPIFFNNNNNNMLLEFVLYLLRISS